MTYTLLHHSDITRLFARAPLVPADDVGSLRSAIDLLGAASRLHAGLAERVAAAEAEGRAAGHAAGLAEGRAEAERAQAAWLFDAHLASARARAAARADMPRIVIGALRRIAGELAPDVLVAGLAERAVADLAPDTRMTVRVAPANAAAVAERLRAVPLVTVDPDDRLSPTDCLIETPAGRVLAGLEVQLQTLERRWSQLANGPVDEAVDG